MNGAPAVQAPFVSDEGDLIDGKPRRAHVAVDERVYSVILADSENSYCRDTELMPKKRRRTRRVVGVGAKPAATHPPRHNIPGPDSKVSPIFPPHIYHPRIITTALGPQTPRRRTSRFCVLQETSVFPRSIQIVPLETFDNVETRAFTRSKSLPSSRANTFLHVTTRCLKPRSSLSSGEQPAKRRGIGEWSRQ